MVITGIVRIFALRKNVLRMSGKTIRTIVYIWGFVMLFVLLLFKLDALPKDDIFPTVVVLASCAWMIRFGKDDGGINLNQEDKHDYG